MHDGEEKQGREEAEEEREIESSSVDNCAAIKVSDASECDVSN